MFESHWGLRESPFRGQADPRFFYCSPTHDEALARLNFLIENRHRVGLLTGGAGSGKTMLLQVFGRQLKAAGIQVASVNMLSLDPDAFLWELATQLHRHPPERATAWQVWRSIVDRLVENRYQQVPTVLLLDDAEEAAPEALSHVVRLARQDPTPEACLTMVLATDPKSMPRLGHRLLALSDLRIELESWEPDDTLHFLHDSLAKVGSPTTVFDREAAARLHELTRGVPRQVSHLAELALAAGAGEQLPFIDAATVESVYEELVLAR